MHTTIYTLHYAELPDTRTGKSWETTTTVAYEAPGHPGYDRVPAPLLAWATQVWARQFDSGTLTIAIESLLTFTDDTDYEYPGHASTTTIAQYEF